VGSSLNQRTAEFSLCNTLVLLLDLAFKQLDRYSVNSVAGFISRQRLLCSEAEMAFSMFCDSC
jgi:hypothetical protein